LPFIQRRHSLKFSAFLLLFPFLVLVNDASNIISYSLAYAIPMQHGFFSVLLNVRFHGF
jgi:hypothetical protein